jgi:hypothetical protein
MIPARRLLLVVAVVAAGSLVAPTAGFSSMAADRSVEVAVAPDDSAYLGVQRTCNNSTVRVGVANRLPTGTALDIDVAVGGTTRTIGGLAPGESRNRTFESVDADDRIAVDASGSGVSVRLTRPLPAGC